MSKYLDRYGKRIDEGDTVLLAVTIGHHNSPLYPWTVNVCRRTGHGLILDGAHFYGNLRELNAAELVKMDASVDLRTVYVDFRKAFPSDRPAEQEYEARKPMHEGWYWCCNTGDKPGEIWEAVVRVDSTAAGLVGTWLKAPGEAGIMHERDWSPHALWLGPIREPSKKFCLTAPSGPGRR